MFSLLCYSSLNTRSKTRRKKSGCCSPFKVLIFVPSGLKKTSVTRLTLWYSANQRPSLEFRLATRKRIFPSYSGRSESTTRLSARHEGQPGSWIWTTTFSPLPIADRSLSSSMLSSQIQPARTSISMLVMVTSQRTFCLRWAFLEEPFTLRCLLIQISFQLTLQ